MEKEHERMKDEFVELEERLGVQKEESRRRKEHCEENAKVEGDGYPECL